MIDLKCGDCLEIMKQIPDKSIDLVLTDPPYNIGVNTKRNGHKIANKWDKISNYIDWSLTWLKECQRILKNTGVLYFWHNDIKQITELLHIIQKQTNFRLVSFCIWDKGIGYRARSWLNRDPNGKTALRAWFNICEYCLHFFNESENTGKSGNKAGLARINNNPECYKPLKDWYRSELERLHITEKDIASKYTKATGKKPHMLKHYFKDYQFEIPTQKVWESVYLPLGFTVPYGDLKTSYNKLQQSYGALRQSYNALRNVHHCDAEHCNIWHIPPIPSNKRFHTCQKPVPLLERLIRVSSNPGAVVLDCFMGSGSTGVACLNTGRDFIGIEIDPDYFNIAKERIESEQAKINSL